jgi:hypothetical protein
MSHVFTSIPLAAQRNYIPAGLSPQSASGETGDHRPTLVEGGQQRLFKSSTRFENMQPDYRRLVCEVHGWDLTLLFAAHRKEILNQARRMYQEVLTDPTFRELLVGGDHPASGDMFSPHPVPVRRQAFHD